MIVFVALKYGRYFAIFLCFHAQRNNPDLPLPDASHTISYVFYQRME